MFVLLKKDKKYVKLAKVLHVAILRKSPFAGGRKPEYSNFEERTIFSHIIPTVRLTQSAVVTPMGSFGEEGGGRGRRASLLLLLLLQLAAVLLAAAAAEEEAADGEWWLQNMRPDNEEVYFLIELIQVIAGTPIYGQQ